MGSAPQPPAPPPRVLPNPGQKGEENIYFSDKKCKKKAQRNARTGRWGGGVGDGVVDLQEAGVGRVAG
jgi:hypothetical protein